MIYNLQVITERGKIDQLLDHIATRLRVERPLKAWLNKDLQWGADVKAVSDSLIACGLVEEAEKFLDKVLTI